MPQTNSQLSLQALQGQFGSADYSSWQSNRKRWYSYLTYPSAGQPILTFFGTAMGQGTPPQTPELTNMPKAGSFGQGHFLLKSIAAVIKINTWNLAAWNGLDASSVYSDLLMGFTQAGVLTLNINSRPFAQIPKPFLYAPPYDGHERVYTSGLTSLTLLQGTPNTLGSVTTSPPYAEQLTLRDSCYLVDPNVFIEAEQNFDVSISFPDGNIPILATSIVNDTTNPLLVGVVLDGVFFRPLQ